MKYQAVGKRREMQVVDVDGNIIAEIAPRMPSPRLRLEVTA